MASKKDPRFETVKKLFKYGHITALKDLFTHIPVSVMRALLHTNHYRMKRIVNDPSELQYNEVAVLAKLIGIEHRVLSELIESFIKETKRNRKDG
jgi:hypothetical protein